MKIILAAGIFYPDVGGPAIHAQKIAEFLTSKDIEVCVITYGLKDVQESFPFKVVVIDRSLPAPLRWFLYLVRLLILSQGASIIYAFDPSSVGLPARIVAKVRSVPFLMRFAGDPIWERIVEQKKRFVPMLEYYKRDFHLVDKPNLFKVMRFVLRGTDKVIVYNQFFKDFLHTYHGVPLLKIEVVKNPVWRRDGFQDIHPLEHPTFLFAGRFVHYKNLTLLIGVFIELRRNHNKGKLVLIGKGPERKVLEDQVSEEFREHVVFFDQIPQEDLFKQIRMASACIAPAISEFNPNFILEALSLGTPVLISRNHGLSVDLGEGFEFDPLSRNDLKEKLERYFDPAFYETMVRKIANIPLNRTWEDVLGDNKKVVDQLLKK